MKFSRIKAVMLRQFYLIRGSFTRIMPLFIWQAIDITIWGFVTKYLNQFTNSGLDFVPQILGTVLVWEFMVRVMHGTSMAFMEDSWSRNFLNIFASPIRISEYLVGLVLTGTLTSVLGLAVMLVLAVSVFGLSMAIYGLIIIFLVMIIVLFAIALGIFGCAVMLRYGPSSEWFIWPIPGIIAPFVGAFYPLSTLPQWMQYVAHIFPPTYVFEAMRAVIAGNPMQISSLIISLMLSLMYIILGCWCFARVHRYAVRTGLIARYSAESIS